MPQRRGLLAAASLRILVLAFVWVCSAGVSAKPAPPADATTAGLYEDARSRAATGDLAGAVVQLKNVLQQDPNHLPARIALGRYLLRQGDAKGAEKELRIALGLGAAEEETFPTLGNALLMQRKYQEILETIRSRDPTSYGGFEVLTFRGRANYHLGQLEEAERDFERARALVPQRTEALIGLALVAQSRGKMADALALVDQAVILAPQDAEVWYQKGEMLRAAHDLPGARAALDQGLKLSPRLLRARLARAGLFLELGDFAAARDDAAFVHEANPDDIQASFILGQSLLRLGDDAGAKEAVDQANGRLSAIKDEVLMSEPYLLRIASLLAYGRRDLARADKYLTRFVELNPNDRAMQRMMGQVKFLLGDAQGAIRVLFPLYRMDPTDPDVLASLGQAYMQIGHYSEASSMLEQALQRQPDNPGLAAQLALSRVGLGAWDEAVAGLMETLAQEEDSRAAALLLTVLQMKRGERDEASRTIQALVEREPRNPKARNLLGIVQASHGDLAAARAAFGATAELAPDYLPPQYNLAKLDLAEGESAKAKSRLEAIVARNPRADAALMLLADVALGENDMAGAAGWLEKAVGAAPQAVRTQARLADLHLALGHHDEALAVANRLVGKNPENALAVETLGNVQIALSRKKEGLRNLRTAVRYGGYDADQLMRIARKQVDLEDYEQARRTLTKATNTAAAEQANAALVRLDIRLRRFDESMARAMEMTASDSGAPLGHILKGDVLLAQARIDEAIEEYATSLALKPSTPGILGWFGAVDRAGRREEAVARLERWASEHPDDIEVQRKLALWYLPMRRLDKAQALHERLLQREPDDPLLLSNLARIYQLAKDARARALAEKAVAVTPNWPVALDTLGWILVTEGETARGLGYLRQAVAREDNPLMRYHLAQALAELGRAVEARAELDRILNSGQRLEWMKDVQRLYDELGSAAQPPSTRSRPPASPATSGAKSPAA